MCAGWGRCTTTLLLLWRLLLLLLWLWLTVAVGGRAGNRGRWWLHHAHDGSRRGGGSLHPWQAAKSNALTQKVASGTANSSAASKIDEEGQGHVTSGTSSGSRATCHTGEALVEQRGSSTGRLVQARIHETKRDCQQCSNTEPTSGDSCVAYLGKHALFHGKSSAWAVEYRDVWVCCALCSHVTRNRITRAVDTAGSEKQDGPTRQHSHRKRGRVRCVYVMCACDERVRGVCVRACVGEAQRQQAFTTLQKAKRKHKLVQPTCVATGDVHTAMYPRATPGMPGRDVVSSHGPSAERRQHPHTTSHCTRHNVPHWRIKRHKQRPRKSLTPMVRLRNPPQPGRDRREKGLEFTSQVMPTGWTQHVVRTRMHTDQAERSSPKRGERVGFGRAGEGCFP